MQASIDLSAVYGSRPECDLRVVCGPRYNAFVPVDREEPGRFFQRALWKAISKPSVSEDDSDRWDGME